MSHHDHRLVQPDHQHSPDSHGSPDSPDSLPDMLDLDAQVFEAQLNDVRADLERLAEAPVRRILDVGAGTGTGTFGLLQHFPDAHALAIDGSPDMLERLRVRAEHVGLANRVDILCADLDEGMPDRAPVDLVWASASLHHLADPDRTLSEVVKALRPGGLVAVVELSGFPRFLPDDTPDGDTEAHAHALLAADRAIDLPTMGGDWGPRLTRAGLVIEMDRAIIINLTPPLAPVVSDYAFVTLTRIRGALAGRLGVADSERLDRLLDGGSSDVRRRRDLHVKAEKQLWIARRPTSD